MLRFSSIQQAILLKFTKQILVIEAIEIREDNNGCIYFNAALMEKKKNRIFVSQSLGVASVNQLADWVTKIKAQKIRILLIVNCDKIYHKIIEGNYDVNDLIQSIAPNTNRNDFYAQVLPLNNGKSVISIARSILIQQIFQEVSFLQDSIISVLVGPFFIINTYKYFFKSIDGVYDVRFENYLFTMKDDDILSYQIHTYSRHLVSNYLSIEKEQISTRLYLAYSAGLQYLLSLPKITELPIPIVKKNSSDNFFHKLSKLYFLAIAGLLFTLLIISSVLFHIYQIKFDKLSTDLLYKQALWGEFQNRKGRESKKIEVLRHYGLQDSSHVSFYADQITSVLPLNVYLKKLEIHPINTKSISEAINFIDDKISIEGSCYSSLDLNNWILQLRHLSWIKSVIIRNYKENDNNLGAFNIEILKY